MSPDLEEEGVPVRSSDPDRLEASIDIDVDNHINSVPLQSESKLMQCMKNCEESDFEMENLFEDQAVHTKDRFEIDVTDCGDPHSTGQLDDFHENVAEYSSSFDDTDYGTEYNLGVSDGEVESMYCGGGMPGSFYDVYGDLCAWRNKKLTDHWRVSIQPLRWHCKWLELQMKELNAQAMKYDNALARYEQMKQLGLENHHYGYGGIDSKSVPNLAQVKRESFMKRRKRKRKEDTMDLSSYMSHHNLFSFYDKKPHSDVGQVEACSGNIGLEEVFDFRNSSSSLEQLLAKIEMAHLHTRKVKSRIEKVISENPVKFASLNSLSMGPRDPLLGTLCNDTPPHPDVIVRPHTSSLDGASKKVTSNSQGYSLVPVNAVPDLEKRTTLPDGIKSPGQKNGGKAAAEVEIDNPTKTELAKEEPVDESVRMTLSSEKFSEQPEMQKDAAAAAASGVGSDELDEGPLHLEPSNNRTTSTTKTYVRKRKRRGRLTVRPHKRSQS